ncbi:serine/threonine-protein kinase [Polyangium jinanense]|uniref:Protein kinase n=1 Tax=Polyangium jinanense TaxID=2829994 RepID=A0A9X3XCM9_9BACT|nr:serine/threonine-protein kinase [Polyangium jinanense]MDC3960035.1 protein kinase [Polyangium jinanense]MDC3986253.1 protein kinase [Polyangium jinanense]
MQAGQQITPTLRLQGLLGKGGMGSVWVADHLALGTQVAVKFMSPAYVENASLVQRFRTEAMAAAQIKSPHVAQVFDHGFTADGTPYIVMELLEGEDLKRRIRREGPLPLKDVALVVSQASKALSRAHALGIVHRDIKPDNIFLCNIDGETFVKLLDFGIAKMGPDSALGATTTGSMMGTPLYMSPEQLLSAKRVDHRSDLWSIAVVAYHAITGRVPFHGETVGSLGVAVHTGAFHLPSTLRPDVPPAVDAWFQRMLRRDPAERFGTAKEMAEALEQAILGAPSPYAVTGGVTRGSLHTHPEPTPAPYSGGPMAATPAPSSMHGYTSSPYSAPQSPASAPQTLIGTSTTAARAGGGKKPAIIAAGVAVLVLGAVGLFLAVGRSNDTTPVSAAPGEASTSALTAAPTPSPSPTPVVAPAPPPTTSALAEPAASAATAKTAEDNPTTRKTATAPATTAPPPPATTTKTAPKPPKGGKDNIGF